MKNEQGFSYTCWFDADFETLYKKRTWTKKKLGRSSSQLYIAKQIRTKYTNTLKNKKKCFELTMSNKLAQLRRCDSKKFWNLLYSEGIDFKKLLTLCHLNCSGQN